MPICGYDGAQRRLQEATLALPLGYLHARPEIEPGIEDQLYHARLAGLTQAEANDACRILQPAGVPCIVVANGAIPAVPAEPAGVMDRATAIADVLRMLAPLRLGQ